jgi:cytochrome c-type biogenesis protein CcmE
MKPPHIIALIVIVVCMIAMLVSFKDAIAHNVNIRQAKNGTPGETVQVPGRIVKDTVRWDAARGELQFDILGIDPKTRKVDATQRMTIVYAQPKPENFNEADSVEAIGRYDAGANAFRAQTLLIKCPSKYNDKPQQKAETDSGLGPVGPIAGGSALAAGGFWYAFGRKRVVAT